MAFHFSKLLLYSYFPVVSEPGKAVDHLVFVQEVGLKYSSGSNISALPCYLNIMKMLMLPILKR